MSGRGQVSWKFEDEEADGEAVGPVTVQRADGSINEWEEWSWRSAAEAYAAEHGLDFRADE